MISPVSESTGSGSKYIFIQYQFQGQPDLGPNSLWNILLDELQAFVMQPKLSSNQMWS